MRFVGRDEIRRDLTFPILVAAVEASHRSPRMEIHDMSMGEEKALYFVRSAADTAAPSAASSSPASPATSLDGTEITWWKTAADSAFGAKLLAPAQPGTLVVVGAGAIAPWLARAHLSVRPSVRRVLV